MKIGETSLSGVPYVMFKHKRIIGMLVAAMENMMLHNGKPMSQEDMHGRRQLIEIAKAHTTGSFPCFDCANEIEHLIGMIPWHLLIVDDEGDGSWFRDYPSCSGVTCTGYARVMADILPGAVVMGFSREDNPASVIAQDCGGHDFAFMQQRFIVDPWLMMVGGGVEAMSIAGSRRVFDLTKSDDQLKAGLLYGHMSQWKLVEFDE